MSYLVVQVFDNINLMLTSFFFRIFGSIILLSWWIMFNYHDFKYSLKH